jgi:hypothetical protein
MKPRPPDFDEELVRKAPTFSKWLALKDGEVLTYAGRPFVKGNDEDEERLMRRIMIARRNNLKDHAELKKARAIEAERVALETERIREEAEEAAMEDYKQSHSVKKEKNEDELLTESLEAHYVTTNPSGTKRRFIPGKLRPTDMDIQEEMDIPAVEATRSYRKWQSLADGQTMKYNQEYTKGDPEHDWLLRKNIWRRMRYRRENQQRVREMQCEELCDELREGIDMDEAMTSQVQSVVDAAVAAAAAVHGDASFDAVAVAALDAGVNDPLVSSALDAAAQLAAAVIPQNHELLNPMKCEETNED